MAVPAGCRHVRRPVPSRGSCHRRLHGAGCGLPRMCATVQTGESYFCHSGSLFTIARDGYEQAKATAGGDREGGMAGAIVAIVFAVASLEAFVNEFRMHAKNVFKPILRRARREGLCRILDSAESERTSLRMRIQLLKTILTGEPYHKGSHPYQGFDDLLKLRASVIHLEAVKAGSPGVTEHLVAKGILADRRPVDADNWLHRVTTPAVARWACQVVVDMVQSMVEGSPLPKPVCAILAKSFRPVE